MSWESLQALPAWQFWPVVCVGGLGAFGLTLFALLTIFFTALFGIEGGLRLLGLVSELTFGGSHGKTAAVALGVPKFALMMLKSLRRNLLRTSLTFLASFVLVMVITSIWSVLAFINMITAEKQEDLKAIAMERYQMPSQMKMSYGPELTALAKSHGATDRDLMTWTFVGCELEKNGPRTLDKVLFIFSTEPDALLSMFEGIELENLSAADQKLMLDNVAALKNNLKGLVLGVEKLRKLNKKVGERIKAYSFNYKDLEFEFEIVGTFPDNGRYDGNSVMNKEYFKRTLDGLSDQKVADDFRGRALNLFWMRLPNKPKFEEMAGDVGSESKFSSPAVRLDTASNTFSSLLDAFSTIFWAMRYLLSPAILLTMAVVIANAISISVRERRVEMAVLKVLGFQPWQVLTLVMGESLLVGVLSGTLSSWLAFFLINSNGGIKLPIGIFPAFLIAPEALWWGPLIGGATAFLGTILPAWSARTVKVSEVFSRVA